MPQGKTYIKIASQTTGSVSSVTFSNVPQNYTDLVLVIVARNSSSLNNGQITYNGNTNTLYSGTYLSSGGGVVGGRVTNQGNLFTPEITTADWTPIIVNIMNYSNSNIFKQCTMKGGASSDRATFWAGLWRSTDPITSIGLATYGGNFVSGSTFTLYGIEAAKVPYATGGDIVQTDGVYWYHAFRTSGLFVPNRALTSDVLVVAGGGGGGQYSGGGGGAGGLLTHTSQSLTASTGYTVTVGAGGRGGYGEQGGSGSQGANSQFGSLTASVGGGFGFGLNGVKGNGGNGGSGGGAGGVSSSANGGSATSGQGNAGGNSSFAYAGAGGGGAGAAAANATSGATNGGAGLSSSLINSMASATGTGVLSSGNYYFAGGGAGNAEGGARTGGVGGGGNTYAAGTINTGGGGGGDSGGGGAGGSGIVIVRYPV